MIVKSREKEQREIESDEISLNKANLRLDPRTKLFTLLLANLLLFFHINMRAEAFLVLLLLLPFFPAGRGKKGIRFGIIYMILAAAEIFLVPGADGIWLNVLSLLSVGIRMLLPCIIAGAYAFTTTTVGEMVCALRRMRIPEEIIIPCVVVIRFFPTVREDYRQIRNAMALRGIAAGKGAALYHPSQTLEYILIPLLMNASNVAQDISAAALTKGIGIKGQHTSMTEIRMTAPDWSYMLLCTLPFFFCWGGVL